MKYRIVLALLLSLFATTTAVAQTVAQGPAGDPTTPWFVTGSSASVSAGPTALTSTTCAGSGCVALTLTGHGTVGIQVAGTFVGTVEFEGAGAGAATYLPLAVTPLNGGTAASSTTAPGIWTAQAAGLGSVRVRFSAYTSGTATVSLTGTYAAAPTTLSNAAPPGAQYIIQVPDAVLSAEQALSALASGIVRVATGTGVLTSLTDSSGIAANLSDETGTGALVFATSPVLVTPNIGAATATSLNSFTFNQSVASGASPTFAATNFTLIPAANLTGTITPATQDLITRLGTITAGVWNAGAVTSSGPVTDSAGSMATIRAGGIGVTSQAQYDLLYASSSTQLTRVPNGTTGQVLTATSSGAPSWATAGGGGLTQVFRGLTIRTSPNANTSAHQVQLMHADEIALWNGSTNTAVQDWNNLVADITVSGAGGLDTGTEGASRWYEIHAIRKSSDGTKNLLLHRAKNYLLDEDTLGGGTVDATVEIRRVTNDILARSQGFQTDVTGFVPFVDVKLLRVGAVVGNIWCELRTNSADLPTTTILATSDKLDASLIATSEQTIRFVFRTPMSLTALTTYHIVITGDWTPSNTVYIGLQQDSSAPAYTRGTASSLLTTTWSASGADNAFKIYVTENDTAVTMPTGYDQRALIGWAYNNSGSDFAQMSAIDRLVRQYGPMVSGGTATIMTLVDTSAGIHPPAPVVLLSVQLMDTVSAASIEVSSTISGASSYANYWQAPGASMWGQPLLQTPIEFQHLYYRVSAGAANIYPLSYQW